MPPPIVNSQSAAVAEPAIDVVGRNSSVVSDDFGKSPIPVMTPLAGRWADEFCGWGSRHASEIITEENVNKKNDAAAHDEQEDEGAADENDRRSVDNNSPSMEEVHGDSDEGTLVTTPNAANSNISSTVHVCRTISYNPYNLVEPCILHEYCECNSCLELMQSDYGHTTSAGMSPENTFSASMSSPQPSGEIAGFHHQHQQQYAAANSSTPRLAVPLPPMALSPGTPLRSAGTEVFDLNAEDTTNGGEEEVYDHFLDVASGRPLTAITPFMPPPPPPAITPLVMAEEGNRFAQGHYARLMLRWYKKVELVQHMWISSSGEEGGCCPIPPPLDPQKNKKAYTFAQWCEMASAWWFANFEHRQKKGRGGANGGGLWHEPHRAASHGFQTHAADSAAVTEQHHNQQQQWNRRPSPRFAAAHQTDF
jgi:hypothetical protein